MRATRSMRVLTLFIMLWLLPSAAAYAEEAPATSSLSDQNVVVLGQSKEVTSGDLTVEELSSAILSGVVVEVDQGSEVVAGNDRSDVIMANYPVVETWQDSGNRSVNLRSNIRDKIINVHGLEIDTVRKVTQRTVRESDGGTRYHYDLDAVLYSCGIWNCSEVDRQEVLVQVDVRTNTSDARQFGVTTAYCPGFQGLCPSWVNASIN